jgi:microsomal dipeptidase-like Zn-dependent dipeptidase
MTKVAPFMTRLVDLHIHPTLKMHYLPYLRSNFHAWVYSGKFWNPLSFRTRYANLNKSPEKVMLCAHYVIEKNFVAKGIKWFGRAVSWAAAPWFYGPLRFADPWKTLLKMMDILEDAVPNTNRWVVGDGKRLRMVRSFAELADLEENEIAMVHAVEGAHALGYEPQKGEDMEAFWGRIEQRLEYLKKRGVALITLAHFWDNLFCPQTDGTEIIPKKRNGNLVAGRDDLIFQMKRAKWRWNDTNHLAEPFARKMLQLGMLIDVSHCQPHAREAIYDLCQEYDRPVVASHVGLRHFFDNEYNMSDDEIRRIHKLGGIIGLILSRRWLVDPLKRPGTGDGIPDIVENMCYIRDLVGDVSCIGIGTDFDGLTDPFKDCETPDKLHRISDAMGAHFSDDEIDQIFFKNSYRVLEKGWC